MKLWPCLGIFGLRQVGKTTLLKKSLPEIPLISLDSEVHLSAAQKSAKTFLARHPCPLVIDEVQKAPGLFDEIKLQVDHKRVPGQFILTGSSSFQSKDQSRESLTGRLGVLYLYPLTLAEAHQESFSSAHAQTLHSLSSRFSIQQFTQSLELGGLPVPMFLRSADERKSYWESWAETTVYRDLQRVYGSNYDPEIAFQILYKIGKILTDGELVTIRHFSMDKRKVKKYLEAMERIFVLKRLLCHEAGQGEDAYFFGDTGLASYFMKETLSEGAFLSLVRHKILFEILAGLEYSGNRQQLAYFKSKAGTPVEFVWNDIPIRVMTESKIGSSAFTYHSRPLLGAIQKLKSKSGILVAPVDEIVAEKKNPVVIVPWGHWS